MDSLAIDVVRGTLVESRHLVSAAVVDADGRLVAASGNPDLTTSWRSAAKPFQAVPLVADGVMERFGLDDQDLALACASHSSEGFHLAGVDRFMAKVGIDESALACGPHPPLSPVVWEAALRSGAKLTPRWSNCSGKHTGLVALAKHHGWHTAGYERAGHPVQNRILDEIERFGGVSRDSIALTIDGCTTVCFGLPLRSMALAYARFGAQADSTTTRIWRAMTAHPDLVAGTGRLCTDLMRAWPGQIVAKVGADGIYSAALPSLKLGLSLKVEDGDGRASNVALLAIITTLLDRVDSAASRELALVVERHGRPPVLNTRGQPVGEVRSRGGLRFFAS